MTPKIIIYSTTTCHFCDFAKQYLKDMGFEFEDIDVAKDDSALHTMLAKSGQMGVPVIDIDGKIIIGFNKPEIDKVLGIK